MILSELSKGWWISWRSIAVTLLTNKLTKHDVLCVLFPIRIQSLSAKVIQNFCTLGKKIDGRFEW